MVFFRSLVKSEDLVFTNLRITDTSSGKKGGVSAERLANDPSYELVRKNSYEFARAGQACKIIRQALSNVIKKSADRRVTSRLTKAMMAVIQADLVNELGKRNVIDGESELLSGFEFNADAILSTVVGVPFVATIDRASGQCTVAFNEFVPIDVISSPSSATHFKLNATALEIDFEAGTYEMKLSSTAELELGSAPQTAITLTGGLPANSTKPLFLLLGVEFFQHVNSRFHAIRDKAKNALAIVAVNGGV